MLRDRFAPGADAVPKKVLVIDDDPDVGQTLKLMLAHAGYKVVVATNGLEGLEKARSECPDLILLDIMMPGMNGWQVCRHMRKVTNAPIIMLTVLDEQKSVIDGLQLGADDYIVKPWSNRELLARIRAVLRRVDTSPAAFWSSAALQGDLSIDPIHRDVIIDGTRLGLTPIEFRLLTYLARRPGRVVPYSELLAQIWGTEFEQDIRSLRWHMHNLRRKIEKDPQRPRYLLVKYGIGYCFAGQGQNHLHSIHDHNHENGP